MKVRIHSVLHSELVSMTRNLASITKQVLSVQYRVPLLQTV